MAKIQSHIKGDLGQKINVGLKLRQEENPPFDFDARLGGNLGKNHSMSAAF